ncbi:uncharacterized protein [Diadema setosum]|uniref:uncharacterized protein n=1 Tax=Diadema setosum TaxID=31175 RepID=UPI003B3ACAC1
MATNTLQLYRTLPLNDSENTQLFTFKLGLMNLDEFKSRSVRSTVINYQGQDWYLSCKYAEGKRHEFLGVYVYWGSPAEGVRCRADFRIITRNVLDPTKSLVTEGSQVEFSAPQSPGWGKREFAPLRELFTPGQGFLLEPEKVVIIELAMKSCSTLFEQSVDFAQLLKNREQPYPSFFTANFPLAGMEFYLSLYPLGDREEADGHVSMYLHRFLGNDVESSLIGCRIRYRFFLGHSRTCPASSKTFEFSFKNEQGYGRFKAFEPLNGSDNLLFRGAVPLGVEIVSITPFAQPEIRLTTRGYYHTDNFVFEDATFPDHRGNIWRLSATNGSHFLSLRLNASDKNRLFSAPGLVTNQTRLPKREECTKFVQWRAFVLSRTDRKKTLSVNGCPLTAYYSRGLMSTNYNMSTQIPLNKAKALDGDYCTKDEPSLLVRIEFLNVQDIAGVMTDYPTLDFERFQLYHTREGLKRCLRQNEQLVRELESLHGRLSSAIKENKDSRELVQDFQKLLKGESTATLGRQVPTHTPSARPASNSSSPTLPAQPPVPRPRGMRGPPPRPPPRAYSPVATDLVVTRQFTYAPGGTTAASPQSPITPPMASSTGMAMVTDQQRLAALNSNDTAFKRFSFTGINITPAMISREASETSSRNVDVPAQSSDSGKEAEEQQQVAATKPNNRMASVPTTASSVVMSKMGNGGSSRGFALARMTRPPVNTSQQRVNQLSAQQPQRSAAATHRLSWPNELSPPPPASSKSTGDLNGQVSNHQTSVEHQQLANGYLMPNSGVANGFQPNIQQSASSPNISSPDSNSSEKETKTSTPSSNVLASSQANSLYPPLNGSTLHSPGGQSASPTVEKGFVYTPVPDSIANRRSPVPEAASKPPTAHAPQVPTSAGGPSQRNPNWPTSLPVPRNGAAHRSSSDNSLHQVSSAGNDLPVNSSSQETTSTNEMVARAKSTPSSPERVVPKHAVRTSKSTPTTPTRPRQPQQQPNHHQPPSRAEQQEHSSETPSELQPSEQQAPPSELPATPETGGMTWNAGLSASQPNMQASTGSLNQNVIYEPLPAPKAAVKMAPTVEKEYLLEQKTITNGSVEQIDGKEAKEQNVERKDDPPKRWSIPSYSERQRMGVVETSL